MAGQMEKILQEFMENTGTNSAEAKEILTRNNWKLADSYREIEQMCISAGQRSSHCIRDDGKSHIDTGSPHRQAIDMGLGAAVNLDKKTSFSTQVNPAAVNYPHVVDNTSFPQPTALTVKIPPSSITSTQQDRIIPIQMDGEKKALPIQIYPPPYRYSGGFSSSIPYVNSLSTSHTPPSKPAFHHQHQTVLDNLVQPFQPSHFTSVMEKETSPDTCAEEEDVFDEKFTKKPSSVNTCPRLKRGFSNIIENEGLVTEARHSVKIDIMKDNHDNMYVQTFVLPDLTIYPDDFRAFLGKELIESSTLVSLEQAGRLNWWAELRLCQRLHPMATSGDGNCLLHAASLAMWGIHDRQLILRRELHETLTKASYKEVLYRRWRYQQTMTNKQSGLVFSESEWQDEWENILRLASPLPRGAQDTRSSRVCDVIQGGEESVVYESLEEFHVFVLAHVLQRPIIVVADVILKDSSGDALAPIPFPGIYLPLEVHPCFRYPLLLTYDAAHFSALAPMEQDFTSSQHLPAAIPLVDPELKLLPLHFLIDPGPRVDWNKLQVSEPSQENKINLLQKFLEVERLPFKFLDVNGDSDRGSCGSQDSDEMSTLVKEKDKRKEEKKKDARMSQQVQIVAKQFGSIGKSMGKKLKQLGKSGKGDKSRQPNVGNEITQSTRVMSNYGDQVSGQDYVLVATLSGKGGKQQQEMIRNYLKDAEERFKRDKELKRQSDVELRAKVFPHPAVNSATSCITPGCDLEGSAQTNYLCPKCFNVQQRESSMNPRMGSTFSFHTFPVRTRQLGGPHAEEIFRYGKSKFYTSSNEDVGQPVTSLMVSNLDKHTSYSNNNVYNPRVRSPSPDYDNVPEQSYQYQQSSPKPLPKLHPQERQHCRISGCNFFGSPESQGLCSKCYQKKYEENLERAMHGITKL